MRTAQNRTPSNHLTEAQAKTFSQFSNSLAKNLPSFRIAWVQPVKENMLELQLESDRLTYSQFRSPAYSPQEDLSGQVWALPT